MNVKKSFLSLYCFKKYKLRFATITNDPYFESFILTYTSNFGVRLPLVALSRGQPCAITFCECSVHFLARVMSIS